MGIRIHADTKNILERLKDHPRESYEGAIKRLIEFGSINMEQRSR